jgi:3',5'-cyclic AMP phosphodiesterase CpdA
MQRLALLLFVLSTGAFPGLRAQSEPLFFVQLTDTQFGMYSGDRGFEQETANYEFAVATANRLKPAFVIVTGDLVNKPGNEAQIAEYLRISAKLDRSIPLYHVAGNHDVGNEPTPETLAAYRRRFGPDFYSFRAGRFCGIVLNSVLIAAPDKARQDFEKQEAWLKTELAKAAAEGSRHIVVFQHHPYFVSAPDEKDAYHNIPLARRQEYLRVLKSAGVRYVFAGHFHENALARDGGIEVVTTGPVGNPLDRGSSGIRIAAATDSGIVHRYFGFGNLPNTLQAAIK